MVWFRPLPDPAPEVLPPDEALREPVRWVAPMPADGARSVSPRPACCMARERRALEPPWRFVTDRNVLVRLDLLARLDLLPLVRVFDVDFCARLPDLPVLELDDIPFLQLVVESL